MLEKKLEQKYVAKNEEDIAKFVGERKKLIVLQKPTENIPQGYTQLTFAYKGERHTVLIPEKAKFFMANPGEDSDPLCALDELAEFYDDCCDFEHELFLENKLSPSQTNVSTLAKNSYTIWAINQLGKQKNNSEDPKWDDTELERLGLNDKYVEDRVKGIAALMLGKNAKDLKATELSEILVHKNVKGTFKEMLTQKEFEKITCWAGSHYEIKPEFRNQGYDIDRLHDQHHKVGWKEVHEKEFVHMPTIKKLEEEIAEYRQKQGKKTTAHDTALIRTYANLKYILKEDASKQLDILQSKEGSQSKEEQKEEPTK